MTAAALPLMVGAPFPLSLWTDLGVPLWLWMGLGAFVVAVLLSTPVGRERPPSRRYVVAWCVAAAALIGFLWFTRWPL
jgi:hypothetical protein